MRQRFYKFFVINIIEYLETYGHEILHDNCYGVTLDMNVEEIVIPKFNIGFVQVYFVRGNKIIDRFMTTTPYRRNAEKKFKKFYLKRMMASLAEIDNL